MSLHTRNAADDLGRLPVFTLGQPATCLGCLNPANDLQHGRFEGASNAFATFGIECDCTEVGIWRWIFLSRRRPNCVIACRAAVGIDQESQNETSGRRT